MALKNQPTTLHPPLSWGLTTSKEETRLVGGAQEEVVSQLWDHTQPHPFNRPRDLGSQEALQLTGCVTLGGCCSSASPPQCAGSGSDIPGVPCSAQPLSTKPCPLSSAGVSPESGPDGVGLWQLARGIPAVTQVRVKTCGGYPPPHNLFSRRVKLRP